jgi:hypothetical protein
MVWGCGPEIVMNDPNGVERKLSDLERQSRSPGLLGLLVRTMPTRKPQCGQCLQRIPIQRFEVFSVSLDKQAERWVKPLSKTGWFGPIM